MKKIMGLSVALMISGCVLANDEISGKVISVIDGNTIEMVGEDNETYKIMLHGIDCPELEQDYGVRAKKFLEKLVMEKSVSVKIQGKDRWGTRQGVLIIEGENDPRHELLKEGLAWTAEKNPIAELEHIKEQAREKSRGLWKEENPTPPWIFRRQQTLTHFKGS